MAENTIIHEISLDGYKATSTGGMLDLGTWGSYGIEKLHLTLDAAWQDLTITAFFNVKGEVVAKKVVGKDGYADVPWEATKENTFAGRIVFEGSMNGQRRISANLNYKVTNHSEITDSDPVPTDDRWNQFVTENKEYRDGAFEAAERANARAEDAEAASEDAQAAMLAAKASEDAAAASKIAAKNSEDKAKASADAAAVSEGNANASERAAASSAAAAATSEGNAAESAKNAASAAKKAADESVAANIATIEKMQTDVANKQAAAAASEKAAAASAVAAAGSAAQAEAQKTAAAKSASDAQGYMQTASGAAIAANASAENAAVSKAAAASSATAAAGSATAAAGDAKTASDAAAGATDAKAAAEKIRDEAKAAQKGAEAARDAAANSAAAAKTSEDAAAKSAADADSTANNIKDSMAQIAANKEAVSQLKEDIDDMLDVVHTRNMYDKNSEKYAYGIYSANLYVQNNAKNLAIVMDVEPSTTYTVSGIRFGWNICYEFSISKAEIVIGSRATSKLFEGLSYIDAERGYKTFTTSDAAKSILLIYWRDGVDIVSEEEKRDKLQIEKNNTYTEYVPYGIYSQKLEQIDSSVKLVEKTAKGGINYRYVKNIPLFTRCSNGFYEEHPDWTSRQYELTALCVLGRHLYTGSHLGFKVWDIGIESEPVDITGQLTDNKYLTKNQYIEQWSINPWGVGGGERIPYKMEYYGGYIFAIVRGGSGFVADDAAERNPNTNVKGETEIDGTVGYFMVLDDELNVLFRQAYYGKNKTEVGYRKPSGFAIDKGNNRIYISCQLYGWMCYDISSPSAPVLLKSYSPLDEPDVSSINGADLSSKCGPIEYQNGCVFEHAGSTYYAVAGYVDGIHVWDVTDISAPTEIRNDMITDTYGLFWAFRMHESAWNTTAHVFDVEVEYPYMYATIAPTSTHGNDGNRISGLIVLNLSNMDAPTYVYYPIASEDWNTYQNIGDVKPSHLLLTNDKVLLNNGNMGIAVYDNSGTHPVYMGCIPSDGDDIYQMAHTDDGRLVSGCHIAPFNFRINRGVY